MGDVDHANIHRSRSADGSPSRRPWAPQAQFDRRRRPPRQYRRWARWPRTPSRLRAPSQNSYTLVSRTDPTDTASTAFTIVRRSTGDDGAAPAAGTYTVQVQVPARSSSAASSTHGGERAVCLPGLLRPVADAQQRLSGRGRQRRPGFPRFETPTGSWIRRSAPTRKPPAAWPSPTTRDPRPVSGFGHDANPSATLADVVGSSGIDQTANTAWAVIDQPGDYAVGVQVFTVQTFTITVS